MNIQELYQTLSEIEIGGEFYDQQISLLIGLPEIPYTTSLDAALTLIPDGWSVTKLFQFREYATARPDGWGACLNIEGDVERGYHWSASGSTSALAMCSASLRAHETMSLNPLALPD